MLNRVGDEVLTRGNPDEAGIGPGIFDIEGEPVVWAPVKRGFHAPAFRSRAGFRGPGVTDVNEFAVAFEIPQAEIGGDSG